MTEKNAAREAWLRDMAKVNPKAAEHAASLTHERLDREGVLAQINFKDGVFTGGYVVVRTALGRTRKTRYNSEAAVRAAFDAAQPFEI